MLEGPKLAKTATKTAGVLASDRANVRIFINGLHAKTGGGKSVLENYLKLLKQQTPPYQYVVLAPNRGEYAKYSGPTIQVIDVPEPYTKSVFLPFFYRTVLPRILRESHIHAVLNFGDVVIPTPTPQLYCFDWAYAVYPDSVAWKRLDAKGYLSRKIKLQFFKRYLSYATKIATQSRTMDDRLRAVYEVKNTVVVPNAVSLDNISGGTHINFSLPPGKTKLLYLTHYYSHKNLEIFIPLARRIREASLPFCLITTIASEQHGNARKFLSEIKTAGLAEVIINVGPVSMGHVPSLYSQCDGLLMPTLLESFSGTYVEAMFHRKTILTSKFDFAEDVCGDAAFYFDPLNVEDILGTLLLAFNDGNLRTKKIDCGTERLSGMPTWNAVFNRYQQLLEELADVTTHAPNCSNERLAR